MTEEYVIKNASNESTQVNLVQTKKMLQKTKISFDCCEMRIHQMHCVGSSIEAQFLIVCCTSMCSCDSVHACMYALLVCCVHSPCQMAKCTLAMHVAIIILQSISFNTVDSRHNHAKYDSCTHRSRRRERSRASEHIETY